MQRKHRDDKTLPTRHYSKHQENKVASKFNGNRTLNSGATPFSKGDVSLDNCLLECKTKTKSSESISKQKEWLEKNEKEALFMGKPYNALAFNFGPDEPNYYIIDENMFEILLSKL
jgi:hypothetical protein